MPPPGITMTAPKALRFSIFCITWTLAPWPTETMTVRAVIPMSTPSIMKNVRSLFAMSPLRLTRTVLTIFMPALLSPPRRCISSGRLSQTTWPSFR